MKITLGSGSHLSPEHGACVMELAAYLTNDVWTDLPVQHLAKDQERAAKHIAAVEEWLATGKKPAAYAYAYASATASAAAYAYAAATAYAYAYAAATATAAADADADADARRDLPAARLRLLDELLDYHEKLLADAGEAIWDPKEWEDEALAFVDSLSS